MPMSLMTLCHSKSAFDGESAILTPTALRNAKLTVEFTNYRHNGWNVRTTS